MKMGIWVVGTVNQLFLKGSYTESKFSNDKVVSGKTLFCVTVCFVVFILFVLKLVFDRTVF